MDCPRESGEEEKISSSVPDLFLHSPGIPRMETPSEEEVGR